MDKLPRIDTAAMVLLSVAIWLLGDGAYAVRNATAPGRWQPAGA